MTTTYKPDTNFVWTDLSSYDTAASCRFYEAVFGWKTYDMGRMAAQPDDQFGMDQVSYYVATLGERSAAGIFDMPPFFQKIKMPPFWMSYLAVDDLTAVVARAKSIEGVIVDVEPTPFGDGMMALIRDPLGAGFTCYDGPDIDSKGDGSEYGRMVWNELITSDIAAVEGFYRTELGFDLVPDADYGEDRVKLINGQGEDVAGIQVVEEEQRSSKVYWMPFFSVDTLSDAAPRIRAAGGEMASRTDHGGGYDSAICFDNTGAAFGVAETGSEYRDARPWYRMFF
ncbi:MAG: VOC family protein [Pseudomonadota bacterium]